MKSDPRADLREEAAVAVLHPARADIPALLVRFALLILVPLAILGLASVAAAWLVRLGADLRLGHEPFTVATSRIRLPMREIAGRQIAVDLLRQVLVVAMVVAVAIWHDGSAWRRRLALTRPAEPRAGMARPWLVAILILLWPVIHIAWVTVTAEVLKVGFGQGVYISPILTPLLLAGWFAYVVLAAPVAEEVLMRGEAFARAKAVLNPAGTITVTALLFCTLHLTEQGIARPLTLLPLAVTLGWLRWRTGRLWPCILLHAWSNVALVAYVLRRSWLPASWL